MTTEKLSFKEKAGFASGEFGGSGLWQVLMIYLPIFFTDTFGVSAAAVSFLFLIVRIFDGINDPVMGMIADRTETRWGKYRPYILFMAVPFAITTMAVFWAPALSESGKVVYAYITYTLLMVFYTAAMIPYSALSGVMTSDQTERTSLNTFRFFGAFVAALIAKTLYQPMVAFFGQGDPVVGNRWTFAIFCVLALFFFYIAFATTKERVHTDKAEGQNLLTDLGDLFRNFPWVIILVVSLLSLIYICIKGGVGAYYFKYYMGEEDKMPTFLFLSSVATIGGVSITSWISRFIDKKWVLIGAYFISSVLAWAIWIVKPGQLSLLYTLEVLSAFTAGPIMPILWAMMADAADYSEWKNGRRATGLVFSASTLAFKAGVALGGFILLQVMDRAGYVANQDQTPEVLETLRHLMTTYAAIGGFLCMAVIFFYPLSRNKLEKIEADLKTRPSHEETPTG